MSDGTRRAKTRGAAGGGLAGFVALLVPFVMSFFDFLDNEQRYQLQGMLTIAIPAAVGWLLSELNDSGDEPPLRSSMTGGLALTLGFALLSGCVSYDPATAAARAREFRTASGITPAECVAFRESAEALDPEDGRQGPETTWKGPLGLEEELERAAEAQRLLAMTCDRALDPTTENVPFEDLRRAYSDAWCAVLELTTEEGCPDAR